MQTVDFTKRSWARGIVAAVLPAGVLPVVLSLAACSGAAQSGPQAAPPPAAAPEGAPAMAPEGAPAATPQAAPHLDRAPIDTALQGFIDRGQIAGAEAIVFKDGQEVYYGSFGFADREAKRAMSRDALIQIYSMSKPVTGVALMQLYEKGLFQLDEPLSKYLPEYAKMKVYVGEDKKGKPILEDARRQITVRDITRHTAGFGAAGKPGLEKMIKASNPTDWKHT
ncbi:MAG TPA: serine hydrolase domain-containing protein, partial [Polyangiaceae bacterium]|nr:serine hydrolase domain-containing protein [Polyangiaceae bacterium]